MNRTDALIDALIARGDDGVSLYEIAAADPAIGVHRFDFTDFDEYDLGPVDLGAQGITPAIAGGAAQLALRLTTLGAVLNVDEEFTNAAATLFSLSGDHVKSTFLASRIRLAGWSGLPDEARARPTLAETQITDRDELMAAWLVAAGRPGAHVEEAAYWTAQVRKTDADIFMEPYRQAAVASLRRRGFDIRAYYLGMHNRRLQVAATPEHPMRAPQDRPGPAVEVAERWPRHSYRYDDDLFDAVREMDRNTPRSAMATWFGGTGRNPNPSYSQPKYIGQSIPDGEDKRQKLIAWATEHGAHEVLRLAVPGSIELVVEND